MGIIYFLVAIIATTLGSLVGLGGGVIIKPSLEFLGEYDIVTISMLSAITVFSMAIVSTYKQVRKGFRPSIKIIYLAIGAIFGGIIGKSLFSILLDNMNKTDASALQGTMLIVILIIVLLQKFLPDYDFNNVFAVMFIGLALGTIASFLGIGGGPINVMIIMMFLNMKIKEAANASIIVILLSQFTNISMALASGGIMVPGIEMVIYMIPAAILGGLIGAKLQHVLKSKTLHKLFNGVLVILIALNIYNVYGFLNI